MVVPTELKTSSNGLVSDWKSDTYTGPAFKIVHWYWGRWTGISGTGGGGYVRSEVGVTNTSEVPISIRVFVDLDDTGNLWDATLRDQYGQPTESRWLEIGNILPGQTVDYQYWWTVINLAGVPYAENFDVTFKLAPQVKIDYQYLKPFADSKSFVSTVA